MKRMNYLIEGLQGSGKSTLVRKLSEKLPGHTVFHEGDYSPVELAWCARMDRETYESKLKKYPALRNEIEAKSAAEGEWKITCYTKIHTDEPGFYQEMEQHEIYNGRMPLPEFRETVLSRFRAWNGSDSIFECSIFQNIVEDMILYRVMRDDDIIALYREAKQALTGKEYTILYLKTGDVEKNLQAIRRERTDENGREQWFPLMMDFFDRSPYAKAMDRQGENDLIAHFRHRQELELRICAEVFPKQAVILRSKDVDWSVISASC